VSRHFSELPTGTDLTDFTAIQAATAAGFIVVEAAGNGDRHLEL